jgi:hypothetical protein
MTDAPRANRLRLYIPLAIAAVLLLGWTLIWFQGAKLMRAEIDEWVAAERAAGRTVEHGPIAIRGYPGSLRAVVDAPRWAEPGQWSWAAEQLLIVAVPQNPDRLILAPRGEQTVSAFGDTYALRAADLRISLQEDSLAAETNGLSAEGDGVSLRLGAGRANLITNEDGSSTLGLSLKDAAFEDGEEAVFAPLFDAALSADSAGVLTIGAFQAALSPASDVKPALLAGEGRLSVAASGYPEGTVNMRLRNPGPLMAVMSEQGAIAPRQAENAEALLSAMGDEDSEIALPLVLENGKLRIGPIPVAELPRLAF